MATTGAAADGINEEARFSSSVEADNDDLKLLRDSVRAVPAQPLKDLLSNGVCVRCIFRLFSLHEQICSRPSLVTPILSTILREVTGCEGDGTSSSPRETKDLNDLESLREVKEEIKVCSVCLGILQFLYNDDNGTLVKKDSASDFAAAMEEVVKQEGHQSDSFSLEVSLPQDVVENEQAVWLYIQEKYSSESWFLEKLPSECFATKDFLKLSVTNPLETLLGIKCNVSSFRVRLTYTLSDASTRDRHIKEKNGFCKRRKTDDSDNFKKDGGFHRVEGHDLTRKSSTALEDGRVGLSKFPLEKVNQCCSLNFQCYRTSVYVGGRYLKYSRNVSQTRWIIDDERMGEASIEEIVGGNILPMCQGDTYKFHAAGREDIDVRMLGTGRPFLVEIQNARQVPSDALVKDIENKINSLESKFVKVKNLKVLGNQGWELMREGEAEKQYAALVWIPRPLNDDDVQTLASVRDMQILQKTPIRVLHRRSPLEREKTIHWMRIERIAGSSQYFLLHLCTQAGTYIKEFVHGDLGRTHPSIGSILKCRAEILQLDVTDVKMDCFQA
ncbi:putative tRNA pseudouridine synthase Pus10 isoform X2 [Sesamum indicum]|uniref:tRNA pseudouridine(55) synthase n=1 Tax=Sesamum indicum TaxID=4182 RepID=A0A8M8UUL1_SESIN|nr:putative tRNA pseudouridine synthase Pus10 isoform X2 [Sesamum indicum]